jgi:hypothetical protein
MTSAPRRKAHAAGTDPLEALPFDALAHVCDRMDICALARFASTCRAAERVVEEATEGALGALRASHLPPGCVNLGTTCAALHCTPHHLRQLPSYKPTASSRVTLVGVVEGLRATQAGWAAVRDELRDARGRGEKRRALVAQRETARHARLGRLDAWFAGVADAAAAAGAAGKALVNVSEALERAAAGKGHTGIEKKSGAMCTRSAETGAVVYPPIALGRGKGAGVRSFAEWASWLRGTRFSREMHVPLPKCVDAYAQSDVVGAQSFARVTRALLAFDARVRHAAAFEEAVQALFAWKRLCVPTTWRVNEWRAAFWDQRHTGCATPVEAVEAITRDAVAGLYDAEKAKMLHHRNRQHEEQGHFIALKLSPAPTEEGEATAWPSPPPLPWPVARDSPSPSPEEVAMEEAAFMAMLGEECAL